MLTRGARVLVEAVVLFDNGAGAVVVQTTGPAGAANPPATMLASTVHPEAEASPPGT